jgi:Xaa-Pro aminopeptidase
MVKDAHELALMRRMAEITLRAHRAVFASLREGITVAEVSGWSAAAHRRLGVDGHEWPYMVRGNATKLAPGMAFTDEPGIYIPGELGIRHEDTVAVTESGCENLAPKWSGTPEEPAVV